jgi:transposase InsO family protein
MDVYLDDILIYSDTVEEHIDHIRIVLDVLRKEKLYLSWDKMKFFARELVLLGHVITDQGIKMDPNKVDAIENWKAPTNKELLSGFLGSVGYLANGIRNVRIPMAALTPLTGSKKAFRWGPTEQRAFEQIKMMVAEHRNQYRTVINDKEGAPSINVTCDASLTGAGGHLSQGNDLENAKNIAFWSGKFNSAQQNYPTHERELLAIVESLKRFKHLLIGRCFRIFTDHRALEYIMRQRNLSPRQARWLEFLCEFDFDICYLPGSANKLSDALSRMYGNEAEGTVRARSEYVSDIDEVNKSLTLSTLVLRLGEPKTVDTGTTVFQRLGFTKETEEPEAEIRRTTHLSKRGNLVRASPDESKSTTKLGAVAVGADDDEAAYSDEGDNNKTATEQPTTRTRSGRAVKPTKRRDHDYTELYSNKRKKLIETPRIKRVRLKVREPKIDDTTKEAPHVPDETVDVNDIIEPLITNSEEPPDATPSAPKKDHEVRVLDNHGFEKASESDKEANAARSRKALEQPAVPEPVTELISSAEGMDIVTEIQGKYDRDPFFKLIMEFPNQYRNFKYECGLLYLKESSSGVKLCVPDILIGGRRIREILITHAHNILAHLGARKTLIYLREYVWWKGILTDVTDFCESCVVCRASKAQTTKPYGLLKTLEIASRPWQSIGIDFVGPLPSSTNRHGSFDMICVIIDHLTCLVHLVPTDQRYRAKHIAEVIFDSVYKLHGLPERIVSDRDSLFTSVFWSNLHKLIGVNLKMSTAYHPQTDGATERANKTMVQMLRQCVSPDQKDWVMKLPAIEFAMNSARSETTGFSPFFLNYGRVPDTMIWNNNSEYPGVRIFAQRMKDAIMTAHDAIIAARVYQTFQANKHRRPIEFVEGDLVYLSTTNLNLPKGRSRKLVPKYIGPYRVNKVKSPGASYELDLPAELRSRGVHPVFHTSLLRPHVPNDDRRFPGRELRQLSAFERAPKEYLIDKIVDHYGKGKEALFKVVWRSGDSTWMTYRDVSQADVLRPYCELMGVRDVDSLPKGKAPEPVEVELHCGAALLKGIKESLFATRKDTEYPPDTQLTIRQSKSLLYSKMTTRFTEQELQAFYAYDAHCAVRYVAEDEGKTFNASMNIPLGYDEWLKKDSTISAARWILEKKSDKELDVNEIGRKMIKRSLFRAMGPPQASSASRAGHGYRRASSFRKTNPINRPGTPYPKIDGIPLAAGPGGTLQFAQMGGRLPAISTPDAAFNYSHSTVASSPYDVLLNSENLRLRNELDEFKAREFRNLRANGTTIAVAAGTPGERLRCPSFGGRTSEISRFRRLGQHDGTYRRRYPNPQPNPGVPRGRRIFERRLDDELSKCDVTCFSSQEGECDDEAYVPRFPIPNPYNLPRPLDGTVLTNPLPPL